MMDGRRHSVDIPISKTLVALRRVRSLRDPSTNSMSKFSALLDNLNWETNSSNGITLGFVNSGKEGDINNNNVWGSEDLGLYGQKEEYVTDHGLSYASRKCNSKLISSENSGHFGNTGSVPLRTIHVEGFNLGQSNQEVVCGNKSLSERYSREYQEERLDLTCITPSSNCLEGVGSCNEPIKGSLQAEKVDCSASKRKSRYRKQTRSSRTVTVDVLSCVGSPCLSLSDAPLEGPSCGTSLDGNEDFDVLDTNQPGCGITCCWSKTPRFREPNLPSDVEDQPLLLGETGEILLSGQGRGWKHINNEICPYSESPRSLSQKFRPKSFSDLVGQDVVARSLLSAISNGRVTPFYLFHGPCGTGKTSASRIFSAALNCLSLEENRPCGICQECVLFFSGRSSDVNEVDSVRINQMEKIRSLMKNAATPPVSSRFKVFIIDDCHLLRGGTWTIFYNNLEVLSQHVVFIMTTPYLDKLPRSAVSRSQRYHFPKLKEVDISNRLSRICAEEGLEFDHVALDFIATKSSGSLRDAEMMLEQLSLLGNRITMSLAYELIGIVSDDELLDLLDLALSSDTSNTVRRARALMRSRIDPMHLISQLANLIMDILSGKCQESTSAAKRKFLERHNSEADMQQLSHALKVLSETEKQLRMSKNQTTWLTVALLQLSSVGSFLDASESKLCVQTVNPRDGDFCSTSMGESSKHLITCACDKNESCIGMLDGKETLESLWRRATEICESNSLKKFLRKQGKLSSVCYNQGVAVAELAFLCPEYICKAEKSWKLIASALQSALGCNVEIRINLEHCASVTKHVKVKKPSFNLFSCSRRMHHKSQSTNEHGSDPSENSDFTSEKAMIRDKCAETCSSDCVSQTFHICCHRKAAARTIRNSDGNALSIGTTMSHRLLLDDMQKDRSNCRCHALSAEEAEKQLALSIPRKTSCETQFCASDPYVLRSSSNNNWSRDEDGPGDYSKVHCWRTPTFPFRKAWQLRHQPQKARLVEWVLPCATAK